jgi:hypothetical protein
MSEEFKAGDRKYIAYLSRRSQRTQFTSYLVAYLSAVGIEDATVRARCTHPGWTVDSVVKES